MRLLSAAAIRDKLKYISEGRAIVGKEKKTIEFLNMNNTHFFVTDISAFEPEVRSKLVVRAEFPHFWVWDNLKTLSDNHDEYTAYYNISSHGLLHLKIYSVESYDRQTELYKLFQKNLR